MHYSAKSMGILPCWGLDDQHSVVTSPEEFTWTKTSYTSHQSLWMTISEVSKTHAWTNTMQCNGDYTNCKYGRANLPRLLLCNCKYKIL